MDLASKDAVVTQRFGGHCSNVVADHGIHFSDIPLASPKQDLIGASVVESAAIRSALEGVRDPEILRSLGELNAIRTVDVDGDRVSVVVALAVPGSPAVDELGEAINTALTAVPGVDAVDISFTAMSTEEQAALAADLRGPDPEKREVSMGRPGSKTRIIGIASGKGGVGKSSVTTNLGVALAQKGKKVGIIDADVWGFSVPKMLGIDRAPSVLEDILLPPRAHGVSVISMDFFVQPDQAVVWRGPMLHKALEQFLVDVHWGDLDYLLIDMPPGTGDVAISISQYLPRGEILIVTTPQPAAQRVAVRAGLMAQKVNQDIIGVVENMSWFTGDDGKQYQIFGQGGGQRLADEMDVPLLGKVPLVPELREGGDIGRPISVIDPDGEAAKAFEEIAAHLMETGPRLRSHPELVIS
ncbi:MAG: Mrp/NBP35 family ATP-binding protein [Actinomycetia bacterium]|nr:Mrp/NBP35 family ATP-binding protein [Actinomycetes bacterium]